MVLSIGKVLLDIATYVIQPIEIFETFVLQRLNIC
jgi:hypothetical protein